MLNVLWYDRSRITTASAWILNEMLEQVSCKHTGLFDEAVVKGDYLPDDGAVIVFHGGNVAPNAAHNLNFWAKDRPWVIFVSLGDENCDFNYSALELRPKRRLWVQTPKPGKVVADRYLVEGTPPDCRLILDKIGAVERIYDWSFCGQINHARRRMLMSALCGLPNGYATYTPSFGAGWPHEEYYRILRQTKVVPCPSGPSTPDTFRLWEALEAGCVPVLDACAVDGIEGYWGMVLRNHPFIVVKDWGEFPNVCVEINARFDYWQRLTGYWYKKFRLEMRDWLAKDLVIVGTKI